MKIIPLTQGQMALIDDEDFSSVSKHKWCATRRKNTFYACRFVKRKIVYLHRFLFPGIQKDVDHIDGNGLNNQRTNLRLANDSQNQANSKKRLIGLSRFKGVTWLSSGQRSNRWMARIKVQYQQEFLGYFDSEENAARAYDVAAKKYFGEFACLNFPSTKTIPTK